MDCKISCLLAGWIPPAQHPLVLPLDSSPAPCDPTFRTQERPLTVAVAPLQHSSRGQMCSHDSIVQATRGTICTGGVVRCTHLPCSSTSTSSSPPVWSLVRCQTPLMKSRSASGRLQN